MFFITENNFYSKKAISIYKKIGRIYRDKKNKNIRVLIVRLKYFLDHNYLKNFKNLKYIITNTTGLDHIDHDYCKKKNIKIISLNNIKKNIKNIQSTSDLAFGIIINLIRNISFSNNLILNKNNKFDRYKFITNDLKNVQIGIIGFGRIGARLANYSKKFGMKVFAYDKFKKINHVNKSVRMVSKLKLLKNSDVIALTATSLGNEEILNKRDLEITKKGAYIVNISRPHLINEEEIYKLIKNRHLNGYGTDVLSNERNIKKFKKNKLFKLSKKYNVIFTPHLGGCTYQSINKTEFEIAKYFSKVYRNL